MTQCLSFHANHLGIIAKSRNATLFSLNRKCPSNHQTLKERIFWSYLTAISNLSNHQPLETVLGYNILAIPTHCVLELLEPLSIMPPSVNIIWDSSLEKSFHVYTLLKLDDISCMTVKDSTNIGTLEGILYLIFCYSSNLTLMPFLLTRTLFCHIAFSITCIFFFSCIFSFHFSLLLLLSLFIFLFTLLLQSSCT